MTEPQPARRIARGRVADQILDDLRDRILSGALPDGTKLPAERLLAAQYGVSGATVREAVRALSAMGLINSKHGSGSSVTAQGDTLLRISLTSVVRLEKMGAADVLGILGPLLGQAVELAARRASADEVAVLRAAAAQLEPITSVARASADLRDYLRTLAEISHNPLLAMLCRFLIDVQIDLALELSGGELAQWQRIAGALHTARTDIVTALESGSADRAAELIRAYHEQALELVDWSPKARALRPTDPELAGFLSSRMGDHVSLGESG